MYGSGERLLGDAPRLYEEKWGKSVLQNIEEPYKYFTPSQISSENLKIKVS